MTPTQRYYLRQFAALPAATQRAIVDTALAEQAAADRQRAAIAHHYSTVARQTVDRVLREAGITPLASIAPNPKPTAQRAVESAAAARDAAEVRLNFQRRCGTI